MKACLICPSERAAVSALSRHAPLSNAPVLGKSLLEYWLEHLADRGVTDVRILAADRPDMVRELVGDGARWGMSAEVIKEARELSPALARTKYPASQGPAWLPEPDNMVLMNHFPGLPQNPLFESYAAWFAALEAWLPRAATENRIGVHEIQPGVWTAMHARIAPTARLRAPCWIGESARIGARCVIGPMAVVEDRAFVEADCEISKSVVGPETFVGRLTALSDSCASGGTLVNCKTGSVTEVPDPFILCALSNPRPRRKATGWLRRWTADYADEKEDFELFWDPRGMKLP